MPVLRVRLHRVHVPPLFYLFSTSCFDGAPYAWFHVLVIYAGCLLVGPLSDRRSTVPPGVVFRYGLTFHGRHAPLTGVPHASQGHSSTGGWAVQVHGWLSSGYRETPALTGSGTGQRLVSVDLAASDVPSGEEFDD